jgi:hypothetical protein
MRFLCLVICFLAMPVSVHAEEIAIGIPIRAVIIQCGTQLQAYESCESGEEPRCCPVVDPELFEEKQISKLDLEKPQPLPVYRESRISF